MQLKVKLLCSGAKLPEKAHETDAGFDLFANETACIHGGQNKLIQTGIAIEIPFGCVGIIKDRSSLTLKGLHILGGVIDHGYIGEILINIANLNNDSDVDSSYRLRKIDCGQKIAQLLIIQLAPVMYIVEVEELSKSERGKRGFGSSDKVMNPSLTQDVVENYINQAEEDADKNA